MFKDKFDFNVNFSEWLKKKGLESQKELKINPLYLQYRKERIEVERTISILEKISKLPHVKIKIEKRDKWEYWLETVLFPPYYFVLHLWGPVPENGDWFKEIRRKIKEELKWLNDVKEINQTLKEIEKILKEEI